METDNSTEAVKRRRDYRRLKRNVRLGQGFLWLLPLLYLFLLLEVASDRPKPPPPDPADIARVDLGEGEGVAGWLERTFGEAKTEDAKAELARDPSPLGKAFWILDLLLILATLGLAGYAKTHPLSSFKIAPFLAFPFLLYLLVWPPDMSRRDRALLSGFAFSVAVSARVSAGFAKKMSDLESRFPPEQLVLQRRRR